MSSPILGIFFVEVFLLEKRPYLIVFPSELIPSLVKFFKGVGVGGGDNCTWQMTHRGWEDRKREQTFQLHWAWGSVVGLYVGGS